MLCIIIRIWRSAVIVKTLAPQDTAPQTTVPESKALSVVREEASKAVG